MTKNHTKFYVGSTGLSLKNRYKQHQYSFRHKKHRNATALTQYIQKFKKAKLTLEFSWKKNKNKNKHILKMDVNYLIWKKSKF